MEAEKKPRFPFLDIERLQRLLVSFLLFAGLYLPLVLALGSGKALAAGAASGCFLLLLFAFLGSFRRGRIYLIIAALAIAAVQLVLPGKGVFGAAVEAVKAISLYLNEVEITTSLFATQIALLLGTVLPVLCYLFASRSAGFLPATIMTVLMLFALCTMGKTGYLFYSAPALVAILLLISRFRHDRVPLLEAMPIAVILVTIALLVLPSGTTVIKPLYEKAMELKQAITDYLFFTDEREIFTIGRYGWYPMLESSGRMGGDVTINENPVMMVKTSKKTLLRGVSKDRYNGASWENTFDMARYQYRSRRYETLRRSVFSESIPGSALLALHPEIAPQAVSVQIVDTVTSTIMTPVSPRGIESQGKIVPYFNEREELFTTHNLERDEAYTVYAMLVEGGTAEMDAVMNDLPSSGRTQSEDFYQRYLQLPDHLEEKFYRDVENIVAGYGTDYDKACAIMRHLQKYYRYTLTPGNEGSNYDFVTFFLYSDKEGYSVHFASAMAVMCRMAGIPSRYVEGFLCRPSSDGIAYVTGGDAYAWCEIWIEGFGWIPFDPTPAQEEDTPSTPPQENPEPTPTPTPPPQSEDDPQPSPTPDPNEIPPVEEPPTEDPDSPDPPNFPWALLLILVLLAAAAVRVILTRPKRIAGKAMNHTDAVFVYAGAIALLAKLRGMPQITGELPSQYALRIDKVHIFPKTIQPLWGMMMAAQYGGADLTAAAEKESASVYGDCYRAQNLLMKLLFVVISSVKAHPYDLLSLKPHYEKSVSQYGGLVSKNNGKGSGNGAELKRIYGRPGGGVPHEAQLTPPDSGIVPPIAETNETQFSADSFSPDELPSVSSEGMEQEIRQAEEMLMAQPSENAPRRRRRGNGTQPASEENHTEET